MHRRQGLRLQPGQPMECRLRERRVRHIVGQRPLLILHEHLSAPAQHVRMRGRLNIPALMKEVRTQQRALGLFEEAVRIRRMSKLFTPVSRLARSIPSAKLVLAQAPKPWCNKGYCDVASLWTRTLNDGDAMGMCDGEWDTTAGLCTIISDRKSTRLNSSHHAISRMPSSA